MLLGSDRVAWIIENSVNGFPEVILCELSEWNADSPANTLSLSSIGRLVPSNRNDNLNRIIFASFLKYNDILYIHLQPAFGGRGFLVSLTVHHGSQTASGLDEPRCLAAAATWTA